MLVPTVNYEAGHIYLPTIFEYATVGFDIVITKYAVLGHPMTACPPAHYITACCQQGLSPACMQIDLDTVTTFHTVLVQRMTACPPALHITACQPAHHMTASPLVHLMTACIKLDSGRRCLLQSESSFCWQESTAPYYSNQQQRARLHCKQSHCSCGLDTVTQFKSDLYCSVTIKSDLDP